MNIFTNINNLLSIIVVLLYNSIVISKNEQLFHLLFNFYSLSEILVTLTSIPPYFDYNNEDSTCIRFEFEPAFNNLEDYLLYSKARAYFDLEDYPG